MVLDFWGHWPIDMSVSNGAVHGWSSLDPWNPEKRKHCVPESRGFVNKVGLSLEDGLTIGRKRRRWAVTHEQGNARHTYWVVETKDGWSDHRGSDRTGDWWEVSVGLEQGWEVPSPPAA